jgi:hypothetical protein
MLIRISIIVALTVGLLLAAIGILVAPGGALGGLAFALLVAASTTTLTRENPDSRFATTSRRSRRAGLAAGGGTLAVWLLITGLVALLGPAAGVILLAVLLPALVIWLSVRFPARFTTSTTGSISQRLMPQWPPESPAELSTKALCLAWQHSQRTLLDAPTAPARREIACVRQQLLDEMERRDSAGFNRWLATGACNGSDPSSYLTTGR